MANEKIKILENNKVQVSYTYGGNYGDSYGRVFEIDLEKIRKTTVKRYYGKSKSWLTKIVDTLVFFPKEEINKFPKDVINKMSKYIANGWYYGKYDNKRAF